MRHTIYLPDELEHKVREYLSAHPTATLSGLVQQALRTQLYRNADLTHLLDLAGAVGGEAIDARDRAEDLLIDDPR